MNAPTSDPAGDSARKRDSSATVTVVNKIPRKVPSCHSGVRTLTRGWFSRSLHRSSPQTGWPAVRAISNASSRPGTVRMSIFRKTTSSPWRSTRSCFKSVRITASAAICGMPASAARSWLNEAASSCGSRSPSRKSLARNSDWSRAGSRCNRVRSTIVSMIRSLRSRTSAIVFWRPLSRARISAAAVTAMMTPNVTANATCMGTRCHDDASSPSLGPALVAAREPCPGEERPAQDPSQFRTDNGHPASANCEQGNGGL